MFVNGEAFLRAYQAEMFSYFYMERQCMQAIMLNVNPLYYKH